MSRPQPPPPPLPPIDDLFLSCRPFPIPISAPIPTTTPSLAFLSWPCRWTATFSWTRYLAQPQYRIPSQPLLLCPYLSRFTATERQLLMLRMYASPAPYPLLRYAFFFREMTGSCRGPTSSAQFPAAQVPWDLFLWPELKVRGAGTFLGS
eukprot:RCo013369